MSTSCNVDGEFHPSFGAAVPSLLFLSAIFYLNFTSRVIFAPLLPVVSVELDLSHLASGSLFLFISVGYFVSILLSGYVSAKLNHKRTVVCSSCLSGIMLIIIAASESLTSLRIGLTGLGAAAGLYLPSGIATIGRLVPTAYMARGMAVHELAPNLSFVTTPLLCGLLIWVGNWRGGLVVLGLLLVVTGMTYQLGGGGHSGGGTRPRLAQYRQLLGRKDFWLVTAMFSMAICSTLGIYAMLPLFLVTERGMSEGNANMLVSASRIASVVMPMAGGILGDRFGNRKMMGMVLFFAGMLTLPIGFVSGWVLTLFVVVQPMVAVCFFPSAFAVLAGTGAQGTTNGALTLTIPLAFVLGGGILPAAIGGIGDVASLGWGMASAGLLMVGASLAALGAVGGEES